MATTTKRKRANVSAEDPASCSKKMKHIENDKGAFEIMSLPDELQLQVLVHAPFEHLPQLRLVCSQWNEKTKSTLFGKLKCINAFGEDIAPISCSLQANLLSADSGLFLIPTKTQGANSVVDWLEYYEIRSLFATLLKKLDLRYLVAPNWILTAYSELSFLDVKYFLKNFVGECDAIYVDTIPLLFKLVPLLLQYKRISLARYVTGLVLLVDNLVLSKIKIPSDVLAKGCFDLLELCRIHLFPESVKLLYKIAMESTQILFGEYATRTRSPSKHRQILQLAVRAMIREGATGDLEPNRSNFHECFKQPYEDCYYVLLENCKDLGEHYCTEIVPTCVEEFNGTSDWRVQLSALTACHISNCSHQQFTTDLAEFALSVLARKDIHPEVRRAAFFSYHRISPASISQFELLFDSLTDALLFLPLHEGRYAIQALRKVCEDFRNQNFTADMIDKMQKNLFEFLLTPQRIKSMRKGHIQELVDGIVSICFRLKTKLNKYKPQYFNTLRTLMTSPEMRNEHVPNETWFALFVDIACLICDDFNDDAAQIINLIEAEGTIYVGDAPLRKPQFLACCYHAKQFTAYTQGQYIDEMLKVFPQEVLEGLDPLYRHSDSEDSEDFEGDSDDDEEEDEDEDVPEPSEPRNDTTPLACIPFTKEQWDNAVSNFMDVSCQTSPQQLFTFEPVLARSTSIRSELIKPLNLIRFPCDPFLASTLDSPEIQAATDVIVRLVLDRQDVPHWQKFLHVLNAHLMSGLIHAKHLLCIMILLEHLGPLLDDAHVLQYLTIVTKALSIGRFTPGALDTLDTCVDFFIKLLLPIPNVDSNLLIGILKLNRGPVPGVIKRDPESISNRSKTLELVTSTWPRASWEALRNRTLRCRPYFRTNDERAHLQHLWHLRLLGINGFAALQRLSANVLHYFLDPMLRHLEESDCRDPILMQMLPKTKLLVELCKIDEDIGLLSFFNQFLFDQEKIKNALIKANKDPGEMKYYSSLLF
jgi:hypothetical protein